MIKKNGQEVFDAVFKNGGHFYVCGDVQMASDVTETLCKIIQEKGKMSKEQAQSYMLKLKVSCFMFHSIDRTMVPTLIYKAVSYIV